MEVIVRGAFYLETPCMNLEPARRKGADPELYRFPLLVPDEDGEGSRVIEPLTISPNTFRSALRTACGMIVWEALPEERRGFFAQKILFHGGIPLPSRKKRNENEASGKKEREGGEVSFSAPGAFDRARNVFLDLWGGGTGIERYELVPSRLRVTLLPAVAEVMRLVDRGAFSELAGHGRALAEVREEAEWSAPEWVRGLADTAADLLRNPPRAEAVREVETAHTVSDLPRKFPEGWRYYEEAVKRYILVGEEAQRVLSDEEKETLGRLFKSNITSRRTIPAGYPFVFRIAGIGLTDLQVGLLVEGFLRFGREGRLGGGNALDLGLCAGLAAIEAEGKRACVAWSQMNGRSALFGEDADFFEERRARPREVLSDPERTAGIFLDRSNWEKVERIVEEAVARIEGALAPSGQSES